MKGRVEVFTVASDGSRKKILSESNLIVDGAGESIVDMLTCPSSVYTISSSVVDASNWRWGAVSFGPAASSFQENAYFFPKDGEYISPSSPCGKTVSVTSLIEQISQDHILRVLWLSGTVSGATANSYTPPYRLPSYPDPTNKKLEDVSTAYSIVSGDGTKSYGHFENRIFWASGDASSYFQGAYPLSGGGSPELSGILVSSIEGDFQTPAIGNHAAVSGPQYVGGHNVIGYYNSGLSVDYRGFIEMQYGAAGSVPFGIATASGHPAGATAAAMCLDPQVTVTTRIGYGDLWGMNLYGGVHQMGLWSLDCKKSLETSTSPFIPKTPRPSNAKLKGVIQNSYVDINGVTPREFRLFAKKTFTENLSQVRDNPAGVPGFPQRCNLAYMQDLLIEWTIDFRSKHD